MVFLITWPEKRPQVLNYLPTLELKQENQLGEISSYVLGW